MPSSTDQQLAIQRYARWYVAALGLAALGVVISIVYATAPVPDHRIADAIRLVCFAIVAESLTYRLPGGGAGSVALIPFMAVALVTPEWPAVAAIGAAVAGVNAVRRLPPIKWAFNLAQTVLAIGAAIHAYRAVGGVPFAAISRDHLLEPASVVPAVSLATVFVFVNTTAVSGIIALTTRQRFEVIWRDNTLGTAAYYIFAAPFAYGLAWMYVNYGMIAAAAVTVPLMGVRQLYKTTFQLQRTNRELLELMVKAIEARDPYTSGHSRRVAETATTIARALQLSTRQVERVRTAALLHDIGKIFEDFAPILRKEDRLTDAEWAIMKTHPAKGAELIATISDLSDIVGPIRHHHERWDGRGYPDGISGDAIPLAARIITFADTLDAMRSDRPYRRALSEAAVRSEFQKNSGTQFDPAICASVLSAAVWSQLFPQEPTLESRSRNRPSGSVLRVAGDRV